MSSENKRQADMSIYTDALQVWIKKFCTQLEKDDTFEAVFLENLSNKQLKQLHKSIHDKLNSRGHIF